MATTKTRKELARRKVRRDTKKLDPEAKREVLEGITRDIPPVTPTDVMPGGHIESDRKKSWTYSDMKQFPIVEFMSEETILITWSGLRYQLLAGAIHYLPKPIRDAYFNHRKEQRDAGKALPADTGFTSEVQLGAGALTPE